MPLAIMHRMCGISREARMPLAIMHRKCGILREARMPVAKMHRKCGILREAWMPVVMPIKKKTRTTQMSANLTRYLFRADSL